MAGLYFVEAIDRVFKCDLRESYGKLPMHLHSFGGPLKHRGAVWRESGRPVHLLFTLDLSDPRPRIEIDNVRWLPLLYAFQHDAASMFYRVLSDDEVEILKLEKWNWTPDFPYENYPAEFPYQICRLDDPAELADRLDENEFLEFWDEFLQRCSDKGYQVTGNDCVAAESGLNYTPNTPCITPDCGEQFMRLFAVVDPVPVRNIGLWSSDGIAEGVTIYYEICPRCHVIHTSNVCS